MVLCRPIVVSLSRAALARHVYHVRYGLEVERRNGPHPTKSRQPDRNTRWLCSTLRNTEYHILGIKIHADAQRLIYGKNQAAHSQKYAPPPVSSLPTTTQIPNPPTLASYLIRGGRRVAVVERHRRALKLPLQSHLIGCRGAVHHPEKRQGPCAYSFGRRSGRRSALSGALASRDPHNKVRVHERSHLNRRKI